MGLDISLCNNHLTLSYQGSYICSTFQVANLMRRGIIGIAATVALAVAVAYAGGILDGTLKASSDGTDILLSWRSGDESGVISYTIDRKAGMNGPFVRVGEKSPAGAGTEYSFRDKSVFRTTGNFYQYKVSIVSSAGNSEYFVSVDHSVSSVRRTWGSIKAMFR
jgi:hypothetical protein